MYYVNLENVIRQEFFKTPEQQAILPTTAIELTDEKFQELWAADQAGKNIVLENNELLIKDHTDLMSLDEIKTHAIGLLPTPQISEVTLANNLVFDDSEKSLTYLQAKRNTSNSQETVYDKYNTSATMSNSELTAAVSVIATSQMSKDDEYKAKVVEISNANSIEDVKVIAGLVQEQTITLIVDVDGSILDDVNQQTDESTNTVVMPASANINLSQIAWINAAGVKSINNAQSPVQCIDKQSRHTADVTFSSDSPVISTTIIGDGLPVTLEVIVYSKNVSSSSSSMVMA